MELRPLTVTFLSSFVFGSIVTNDPIKQLFPICVSRPMEHRPLTVTLFLSLVFVSIVTNDPIRQ